MKLYVAYGSNMDAEQMEVRCPWARLYGKGVLQGYRLTFRKSQTGYYATIEKDPAGCGCVPVLLWIITDEDELRLDLYEGFPRLYRKEPIEVEEVYSYTPSAGHVPDQWIPRGTLHGMVYRLDAGRPLGRPSTNYMNVIAGAYRFYGFDMRMLLDAYAYSVNHAGEVGPCKKE